MNTAQSEIYEESAHPMIAQFMSGKNITFLGWGAPQKSGKTFTILGGEAVNTGAVIDWQEERDTDGILPRFVRGIFDAIVESDESLEFTIKVSVYEVWSGSGIICDLLNETHIQQQNSEGKLFQSLKVTNVSEFNGLECLLQEDTQEIEINGLIEQYVGADDELLDILASSIQKRKLEKVNKKDTKFASNLVVELTVTQKDNQKQKVVSSKLTCIDLESPLQDVNEDEEEEIENGHNTYAELCSVISQGGANQDDSQFYSSSLSAILYSRSLHNCIPTVFVNCSPAIPHAAQHTLPNLDFAETVLKNVVISGVKAQNLLPYNVTAEGETKTDQETESVNVEPVGEITKTIDNTADALVASVATDLKKLQDTEKEYYQQKQQIKTLQQNIDQANQQYQSLQQVNSTLTEQIEQLQKQLETTKQSESELKTKTENDEEQIKEQLTKLEELNNTIKDKLKEIESLSEEKKTLESNHQSYKISVSSKILQLRKEIKQAKSELTTKLTKDAKELLSTAQTSLFETMGPSLLEHAKNQLSLIKQENEKNLATLSNQLEAANQEISQLKSTVEQISEEKKVLEKQVESEKKNVTDLAQKVSLLEKQEIESTQKISSIQNENEQYMKQVEDYKNQIVSLSDSLKQSKTSTETAQNLLDEETKAKVHLETELAKSKETLEQLNNTISEKQREIESITKTIEIEKEHASQSTTLLKQKEEEIVKLQQEKSSIQTKLSETETENSQNRVIIENLNKTISEKQQEIETLQNTFESEKQKVGQSSNTLKEKEDEVVKLQKEKSSIETKLSETEGILAEERNRIQNLEQQVKAAQEVALKSEESIAEKNQEIRTLNLKIADNNNQIETLTNSNNDLKTEIEDLNKQMAQKKEEAIKLRDRAERAEKQNEVLTSEKQKTETTLNETKISLEESIKKETETKQSVTSLQEQLSVSLSHFTLTRSVESRE